MITDQFYEQLAPRHKGAKEVTTQMLIWSSGIFLIAVCIFLMLAYLQYATLFLFLILGVGYGIFLLSGRQNVEYEYIFTNGTVDIDKIVNQKHRKRIVSFQCSSIRTIVPYDPDTSLPEGKQKHICVSAEDAVVIDSGKEFIVFSPNEKMMGLIKDAIPRYMQNDIFKRH